MGLFDSFGVSASGMTANRFWADLISNNVANINSTGTPGDPNHQPYRREVPVFGEILQNRLGKSNTAAGRGVNVIKLARDNQEPRMVYEPDHPDADPQTGYVAYPNINILNEMVNLIAATRAYEANVTALEASKTMAAAAIDMGR
ncbi:flagellar basal-body rod protein FlgC [Desulfotomaculum arcticum]|uniref:Flagellar basal-body rod protein FlgC n=1 Tax=Desulfotruncus arcticus DSM 17038 TaxID=1121424 RepID=A0A1I2N314_9FIRM|nr:flagellar basal body rod protein FlgC [Desulfotruncus arcticus]SFF95781.1 flagellar basal-body rod protein FlgC [Desulfotomaculum arcticum] [Desulfotruncus arcticus DSM 17038]